MRSLLLIVSTMFACMAGVAQNVAINNDGSVAHASAALDVKSNNKGLLIPRLTTAERTAIASPAKGLLVFDTNTNTFWFHNGAAWTNLAAGGSFALPFAATANSATDVFSITNNGKGTAIYARNDGGRAAYFVNTTAQNRDSNLLEVVTHSAGNIFNQQYGNAASFTVTHPSSVAAAVKANVNTTSINLRAAAVLGESAGSGGHAGVFLATNPDGNGDALSVITNGNGSAITAYAKKGGNGVAGFIDGAGYAIYGLVSSAGKGIAGRFLNSNPGNNMAALSVETRSTGNIAVFRTNLYNVARISYTGKGYFNGGTQNSGADLAEAFDVTGDINSYEPGDVLVIATDKDRAVEKSAAPYSTLVAGVYATKPGVLLTEENIDSDLHDKVPMGVVGVIPTRVCLEGGAIKRGDMLVTSSLPGVAMKADPDKVKPGQVIGKALQDFNADTVGKIKVLVNVK